MRHLTAASDRPCAASGKTEDAESDAEGRFQLRVPCPGVWRLSGEALEFPMQGYEQHGAFSTGIVPSQALPVREVVFRMIASSSVVGTVIGSPLGKYILIAVDRGWGIDQKDAETVNAYLAHGVPVDLKGVDEPWNSGTGGGAPIKLYLADRETLSGRCPDGLVDLR